MSVVIIVLAAALAASAAAQQPSSTPSDRVVVEGCVVPEREVKGHASDVAERIGFNEHFVLFAAKVIEGRAPEVAAAPSGPPIYVIAGLTDEQLDVHVGRRVRIDGTFGSIDRGATPADPKNADVVDLTVSTIRQVPGDCSIPRS